MRSYGLVHVGLDELSIPGTGLNVGYQQGPVVVLLLWFPFHRLLRARVRWAWHDTRRWYERWHASCRWSRWTACRWCGTEWCGDTSGDHGCARCELKGRR